MNALTNLCGGKKNSCCGADTGRRPDGPPSQIKDLRRGSCEPTIGGQQPTAKKLPARDSKSAYVTLATNDAYALGCLVLAESLHKVSTRKDLVVMITPLVSPAMRKTLAKTFDSVKVVNVLDSADVANLALLQRPELGITLTKIHCWTLVEYKKAVFLDADTLVLRNCDELFDQFEEFSAAPDVGWPDCFNSGVFVFQPSLKTFKNLIDFAAKHSSFDGGDQGLLNMFFSDWARKSIKNHLPFIFNMVASIVYTYRPAYKVFGPQVKIVHFLGAVKPWHMEYDVRKSGVKSDFHHGILDLVDFWWHIFVARVFPLIENGITGVAADIVNKYKNSVENQQGYYVDYKGADAFTVIERTVTAKIPGKPK